MADEISDYFEISKLIHRYNSTVDQMDFDGWAACFADGGVFDGAYQSFTLPGDLDAFRQMSLQIMDAAPNIRHLTTNLMTTVDGDRATAESFLTLISTPNARKDGTVPNSRILQAGAYHDELVRVDGQWKFKIRRVKIDGAPNNSKAAWTAKA